MDIISAVEIEIIRRATWAIFWCGVLVYAGVLLARGR